MMRRAVRLAAADVDAVDPVPEDGVPTRTAVRLDSGDGYTAGVWEAGPMTWDSGPDGYPVDETCVVISGTVVLRYPDGGEQSFGPGEGFAIARGTPLVWHQDGTVRKFFAIRAV